MAKSKVSKRVNGRNGEYMQLDDESIRFKTGNNTESIPLEVVSDIYLCNTEEAREAVSNEDLVPYGAWTANMPSVAGKSVFLIVKGRASLWVMEINKNQVPNANTFVHTVKPNEDDQDKLRIPNRAINTPLGGLFTIGSIVCVFLAIMLVYTFRQPVLALICAVAAIVMFFNVK